MSSVPDFDQLPKLDGLPQGYAWKVFDRDGEKDVLGTLNFLTPEVVKAASKEVKDGISISLNWPINALAKIPLPGRKPAEHTPIAISESMAALGVGDISAWDDELTFNTQCSSQWDSLCHFQHQPSSLGYNGSKPTHESLRVESTVGNKLPSLDHWHSRGCLVGRGVLLDYKAYADAKGIAFHAFDAVRITVEELEACAAHQGVDFRPGDVLLVRTGATEVFDKPAPEVFTKMASGKLAGVHGCEDTARWIWNKRFAAVASDSPAFEAFPPLKPDGTEGTMADLVLHPYLLAGFGMSIGEFWDLSRLAEYCGKTGRYSFMLTSAPLNHPGLVASPPNALAIF
ncbi:putative cyclase-domain-containing protein [Stachybotrys elegans]|uniref:Cyclase-domain-containing protein n=1 Tax=Stachybotrys elegans TaxID=80388 RepID=A0A8K0WNH4_9HYPO|nr:putative cyclase-domain-containing protein [Stachybotrys elegans]